MAREYHSRAFIIGIGIAAAITAVLVSAGNGIATPLTYVIGPICAFISGATTAFMALALLGPPVAWLFKPQARDVHVLGIVRAFVVELRTSAASRFRAFVDRAMHLPAYQGGGFATDTYRAFVG